MASHPTQKLHVGLVGAGLGGLTAAISIARGGCKVTVLEAAAELGEIGAGIQMTPNASRFLLRWGVAELIGKNLVEPESARMRGKDGKVIDFIEMTPRSREFTGFPWWTVHRHHLHQGLSERARRLGVTLITGARVSSIEYENDPVEVTTCNGKKYTFDLLIGSDGINSIVRKTLFPTVKPRAPTNNAAYRAVIPYAEVFVKHPELKPVFANTFDIWQGEKGYIISYPISGGTCLNLVLSHHRPNKVEEVEEVDMEEFHSYYADWDPNLNKVINMIQETQRWPLMVTGPLKSWSSERKNVVLIGDAAHSMTNHMAQGAATSMEDGAFLGRCLLEVNRGSITVKEAVSIYERKRMGRAFAKQQASFMMGDLYMLNDGVESEARNISSQELYGGASSAPHELSWNIWGSTNTSPHIYTYDAEGSADFAIIEHLQNKHIQENAKSAQNEIPNPNEDPNHNLGNTSSPWAATDVTKALEDKWKTWFLEEGKRKLGLKEKVKSLL